MVFNTAESCPADAGYTSFLSRLGQRTTSSVSNRVLPKKPVTGAVPKASVAIAAPASKSSTTLSAAAKPNEVPTSSKPDANGLKRKAEEDIARPSKAQETGKLSAASKPSTATTAEPAKAPKKGSYRELLERAKTAPKVPAGAIVNKPRTPAEPLKNKWQRKAEKERAKANTTAVQKSKSNSPGSSGGEKAGPKLVGKGPLAKKPAGDGAGPSKKVVPAAFDKKSATAGAGAASLLKSKAVVVDPKGRPTAATKEQDKNAPARRGSKEDYLGRGGKASVYDKPKAVAGKRYIYREDSDSDSDMEATGIDILEEEEISAKRARLEDIEQERLEKKLAAEKAARKKAMMGKK